VATKRIIEIKLNDLSSATKTTVGDLGDTDSAWICKGLFKGAGRRDSAKMDNGSWASVATYMANNSRYVQKCTVPRPIPRNYKLLTDGGFFGFWSLYRDSFGMKTHGSGGAETGVYGQILNLMSGDVLLSFCSFFFSFSFFLCFLLLISPFSPLYFFFLFLFSLLVFVLFLYLSSYFFLVGVRNMAEFSFILSIFPSSFDSYEAHPQLCKDTELLRSGRLKMWSHVLNGDVDIRCFLALVMADSVEVCKMLDHGGTNCHLLCPFCSVS
jgi:hypothetical protein